ncbi:Mov34/MPN/PAD-1 family protein [Agathobaculum sp.]|uniref:Mov34/MPN/PAD-1 family protein n=1 Tax=Agathobaculum sp. TaxID=2048138 RepID=UPI002A809928|nr:Mov34/MPN/PAD-1 family protein [Agathobaculum sp.]MDY3618786.1 Mov34/MPN/PAD-1 family protein [Agathobaculum sp.]
MQTIKFINDKQNFGVILPGEILDEMHEMCIRSGAMETGGILIGHYSSNNNWAIIARATEPPKGSRHFPVKFVRSSATTKKLLDNEWKQGQYYLGEWHYHPNASPKPSKIDYQTIVNLSRDSKLHCPEPVMIVVGGNVLRWKEYVGVFASGKEIVLKQIRLVDS